MNNNTLLKITNLNIRFHTYKAIVSAIQGVNLNMREGETLGLVGESGCGKTVTASAILQLIPTPPGEIVSGEILFEGEDILRKNDQEMRSIRGKTISMIFQDPMTSLNPVFTIGEQITSVIKTHQKLNKSKALKKATEMLFLVGLSNPKETLKKYAHELSGGMCQRVMIAMALSCKPKLLIADEPTTALDVTVQAQILQLMNDLKKEMGTAILLITHDLGVIAKMCDGVAVMYAGRIVENGTLKQVFKNPLHPYTQGLLASTPKIGDDKEELITIEGNVPDLTQLPPGCFFSSRCNQFKDICGQESPGYLEAEPGHIVSCHNLQLQ
ncbi:ABC transporter ATP-binding protein [bacterium]|nr:ABC transporter ATP-binding protein [bacterium]